ncbi:peptidase M24 [Bacillus manliponensis]|uniref:Peptidase M24 n=1 Tax=Bacillus manliponensis TaxID=574376 RepID=A0A073JXY6_9BACI|nr:M23 family metallopeptidase [Bacillus manliponensis]KEK19864.1 peptidase M24 [Bacillus manliponensis]
MFQRIILTLLIVFIIFSWGTVFIISGVPAVVAWWSIQACSIVGIVILIISFILIIAKKIKQIKVHRNTTLIFITSIFVAWPFSWFVGISQMAYPVDVHSVTPVATIRLPMNEPVVVGWGGDEIETNYHTIAPNQRWAYDFVLPSKGAKRGKLEDYDIYGMEIVAPASGKIIAVHNSEKDVTPGKGNNDSMFGNYVYLQLEETGTYIVMSHLKKGSVKVKKGQYVTEGEVLAEVGNSGNSSEPHLHIHHQRQNPEETNMFLTEGLPLYFRDIDGPTMPTGGVHVKNGRDVPVGDRVAPTGM